MHRTALLVAALLLPTALSPLRAQEPRPPQRLDQWFRDPAAAPTRLEVDGSMVLTSDLTTRSEAVAADPALHNPQLVILDLLRAELQRTGKALDDETLDAAYEVYRKPYDDTPFTVKVIATKFKGYPSLEAFVERWRVVHAFQQSRTIDKQQLEQEAERWQRFLGDGTVNVDLWFYAARDEQTQTLDFTKAEQRATAAAAALRAGADAEKVRADSDAVAATAGASGRALGYNALRQVMGESEYTDLGLTGSAAHQVFHDAAPGAVVGPLRSVRGFWLARVEQRHEPKRKFEVKDERTAQLVREVLVQRLFLEWANDVVAKAVLRAPPEPGTPRKG